MVFVTGCMSVLNFRYGMISRKPKTVNYQTKCVLELDSEQCNR